MCVSDGSSIVTQYIATSLFVFLSPLFDVLWELRWISSYMLKKTISCVILICSKIWTKKNCKDIPGLATCPPRDGSRSSVRLCGCPLHPQLSHQNIQTPFGRFQLSVVFFFWLFSLIYGGFSLISGIILLHILHHMFSSYFSTGFLTNNLSISTILFHHLS